MYYTFSKKFLFLLFLDELYTVADLVDLADLHHNCTIMCRVC